MEIMLPPEYFSSMQSVSMLNSQESNAFIILSSNMALLTRKNFRLIPVRNQTGVSCAPENHQLTVDKWFSPLSLLSQHLRAFVRLRKVSETGSFSTIPSFTFSQPISPFIAFVLYIGLTLTILRIHFILVTGESRISRLSGEVHTPVWPQAFMGPVGHYDHPCTQDAPWRSTVFGAVPAARVCTLPSKAERTQMNDNVVIKRRIIVDESIQFRHAGNDYSQLLPLQRSS